MRSTASVIGTVLCDTPDIAQVLEDAHEAAWARFDRTTLELCRLRIATLLGNVGEAETDLDPAIVAAANDWPPSSLLTGAQHACLAFTDEFVIDVASLSDSTAAAVVAEISEQGFADFVNALLVVEQRQRMRLAWSRLFPEVFT
jgi:hypothetical protein